jgi:hypothetical protein
MKVGLRKKETPWWTRGKRTNSSEEEIVENVLSNRQTDDYQQNKIQRIKVKEVTTTDK